MDLSLLNIETKIILFCLNILFVLLVYFGARAIHDKKTYVDEDGRILVEGKKAIWIGYIRIFLGILFIVLELLLYKKY